MQIHEMLSTQGTKATNCIDIVLFTTDQSNLAYFQEILLAAQHYLNQNIKPCSDHMDRIMPIRLDFNYHRVNIMVKSKDALLLCDITNFLRELDEQ